MHSITVDSAHRLIEVVLAGTLTVAETDAYMTDLRSTMLRHGLRRDFAMVIDVGGCTIQTQDMIRAMGEHMATMPKARALAVVTESQLARLQVRRLFTQSYARVVSTREEGRAWVIDGREPRDDPAMTNAS